MHRLIGTAVVALLSWQLGGLMGKSSEHPRNALMGVVAGMVVGFAVAPLLISRPFDAVRRRASTMPAHDLASLVLGLVLGLLVGALIAFPLSLLPWSLGKILPLVVALTCAYLGAALMLDRRSDLLVFGRGRGSAPVGHNGADVSYVLDTSAIIDGRIADIVHCGFVHGALLVPQFVLTELQHIADSPDALRRSRGRRGLDILYRMQKDARSPVQVVEHDARQIGDVDGKLVHVAKELGAPVITNDFNLNRIAELQGVRVLNINQLANALKPIVLPGEEMCVKVIQEGKEQYQGLAYLDDGTMIVVEGGKRYLNSDVDIVVTRVLQTSAGRMIFAHPRGA